MTKYDWLAICACVLCALFLIRFAGRAERDKRTWFKLLWLVPLPIAFLGDLSGLTRSLVPLCLGAVITAGGFFTELAGRRRLLSGIGAGVMLLSIPCCLLDPRCHAVHYLADFEKAFTDMKRHYVLTAHKGIDWDALYAKYQPRFAEIDRTQDAGENALEWMRFCGEFYDGHVNFSPADEDAARQAARSALGNDYGLVIMRCTDGSFAAVNADDSLKAYGIGNGTVITAWDGKAPDEVQKMSPLNGASVLHLAEGETAELGGEPDADNNLFWSASLAAGIGGERVKVRFLDESGKEQSAELPKTGAYADRLFQAVRTIQQGVNIGNLQWQRLDDTTVCLRIKGMMYDTQSYQSSEDDANAEMVAEIRQTLLQYRESGVRDLVIDLRSNTGGSGSMVRDLVSVVAPEGEHFYTANGLWDDEHRTWATDADGNYTAERVFTLQGEQLLGDGRITVLVNSESISAADHMVHLMRGMEHVTVMGFTEPNGSGQAVGGTRLESGVLMFSNCVMLDENGEIFVDSGTDHQSGNGVDVQIPFDSAAIHALFDEGRDYVLDYAMRGQS